MSDLKSDLRTYFDRLADDAEDHLRLEQPEPMPPRGSVKQRVAVVLITAAVVLAVAVGLSVHPRRSAQTAGNDQALTTSWPADRDRLMADVGSVLDATPVSLRITKNYSEIRAVDGHDDLFTVNIYRHFNADELDAAGLTVDSHGRRVAATDPDLTSIYFTSDDGTSLWLSHHTVEGRPPASTSELLASAQALARLESVRAEAHTAEQTGTIVGRLVMVGGPAGVENTPIAGHVEATDGLLGKTYSAAADKEGLFTLHVPKGTYVLTGGGPAYQAGPCEAPGSTEVEPGQIATVQVECQRK